MVALCACKRVGQRPAGNPHAKGIVTVNADHRVRARHESSPRDGKVRLGSRRGRDIDGHRTRRRRAGRDIDIEEGEARVHGRNGVLDAGVHADERACGDEDRVGIRSQTRNVDAARAIRSSVADRQVLVEVIPVIGMERHRGGWGRKRRRGAESHRGVIRSVCSDIGGERDAGGFRHLKRRQGEDIAGQTQDRRVDVRGKRNRSDGGGRRADGPFQPGHVLARDSGAAVKHAHRRARHGRDLVGVGAAVRGQYMYGIVARVRCGRNRKPEVGGKVSVRVASHLEGGYRIGSRRPAGSWCAPHAPDGKARNLRQLTRAGGIAEDDMKIDVRAQVRHGPEKSQRICRRVMVLRYLVIPAVDTNEIARYKKIIGVRVQPVDVHDGDARSRGVRVSLSQYRVEVANTAVEDDLDICSRLEKAELLAAARHYRNGLDVVFGDERSASVVPKRSAHSDNRQDHLETPMYFGRRSRRIAGSAIIVFHGDGVRLIYRRSGAIDVVKLVPVAANAYPAAKAKRVVTDEIVAEVAVLDGGGNIVRPRAYAVKVRQAAGPFQRHVHRLVLQGHGQQYLEGQRPRRHQAFQVHGNRGEVRAGVRPVEYQEFDAPDAQANLPRRVHLGAGGGVSRILVVKHLEKVRVARASGTVLDE